MNSTTAKAKGPRLNNYKDSPLLSRTSTAASKVELMESSIELASLKFVGLSTRSQQIHEIIQDGIVSELRDYLLDNSNVKIINNLDEEGVSLLHLAARWNRVEMTQILIDHGARVNIRLKDGSTPLHVAARFNCPAVAEVLLNSGAKASLVDSLNNTALHHAVRRRNKDMVDLLVRYTDIDVNAKTQVGMTALHLVCMNGDLEICRTLLRHNADIRAKTADDSTPLHTAIFNCNSHLAELLIKQDANSAVKPNGATASHFCLLHLAISQLINVEEYVNEPDSDQDRALHLAAETGNVTSVELCLRHGAHVNTQKATLTTPLHIASMKGDLEIVEILCKKGADLHMKDNEKQTPLHRAANENRIEVIKALLSLGAQIDIKANDNCTPFLMAVAAGSVESALLFRESGADVHASTSDIKNCLHLAVDNGHLELLQLLLEDKKTSENLYKSDARERVPLHDAATSPNIKILELLLTKYSRGSFQDQAQQTPLHLAAQSARYTHVEALGKAMSGINERDDHGMTPIHLAAMKGNRKACQVLTRLGADVNARDNDRWTPLMWAARSGCDKTTQELLNKQASLDHVNNSGNTPLHIASSYGNVRVVELLLNSGANVCIQNNQGQNCLDVAVQSGAGDVALAIAKHKRWPEILECRNVNHEPPMKILIEYFPEAANLVMDHCIKRSSHIQTDPNYTEWYDFHLLDPGPDDETNLAGNRFFGPTTMVKFNRESLLLHPLTQKLLDVKWASFGRYIYYFNFLTYLIFLITYTIFIVTERNTQDFNPTKAENETEKRVKVTEIFIKSTVFNGGVLYVALVFAFAHILKEIFQLFVQRRRYFRDISNITEWALYVTTLCFMMPYMLSNEQLEEVFGSLKNPRNLWIFGIVSIFLCYVNAILFLRRFQPFGIYVSMFLEVFKTVARVFLVFFIFIIAFAVVFFVLFKEQEAFRNVGWSIVKVSVMMVGEFEYLTTFIESISSNNERTGNPLNPFPEIAATFIFVFLLLMSIILMNLLVGLAVGDIESVQRTATLQRMAMQVSFVAEVEDKYPRFITRRIYNPSLELKPNAYRSKLSKLHAWVIGQAKFLEDETSLTPCEEMTESTIYDIQQQVNKTKKRVKTLVRTMELQNRLLVMMARKMNLGVEADELDTGDWVPEAQPGTAYGLLLGDDDKSEDEKEESKRQMARL